MPTYIDVLPKDLRTELKYYMNHSLALIINRILCKRYLGSSADQNVLPIMTNLKNTVIPSDLQGEVISELGVDNICRTHIKITSTPLVTPMTLIQMLNYMYDYRINKRNGRMPLLFYDDFLFQEFNKALLEVGYIERINFNPHNQDYELVAQN